jgi:Tfp pilus assembly PilM family ATPase
VTYNVTACLSVEADSSIEALEIAGFAVSAWDAEEHAPVRACGAHGRVSVHAMREQMCIGEER